MLHGMISAIDEGAGQFLVSGIPFVLDSADSVSLRGEDGVLVNLLDAALCNEVLPLLCLEGSAPQVDESLLGMIADISQSVIVEDALESGDLILYQPLP